MGNDENAKTLFLTTEEVMRILRVSKRTLQNYRNESKLHFYKMSSKTIRYKESDVLIFLQNSSCSSYLKDVAKKYIPNL
jgi:predicted site-specific integrase-resolvase